MPKYSIDLTGHKIDFGDLGFEPTGLAVHIHDDMVRVIWAVNDSGGRVLIWDNQRTGKIEFWVDEMPVNEFVTKQLFKMADDDVTVEADTIDHETDNVEPDQDDDYKFNLD